MNTKRFVSLLVAISLLAITVLVVREASATASVGVDSATNSYTAWAKAAKAEASTMNSSTLSYTAWAKATETEVSTVDSATRSYIAQAKAVGCRMAVTYGPNLDSATQSYIAWGLALPSMNDLGGLCR